jgi:hypothetical protein
MFVTKYMDYETFSHNTHFVYKLSWYYMFPLQRTGTHLVFFEFVHMFDLVWIWIENPRENKIEKALEIPEKWITSFRPKPAQLA